ncbi:MAG: methyltransferase domain-containing protein [Nitrospinaceae bacterium]
MKLTASVTATAPLPAALQQLIHWVKSERTMSPHKARDLLLQGDLKMEDLEPWAEYDHPAENSYGRRLVFDGGFFEMMVMSWDPGDCSAIHDHGHTQWGAVQIFGPAEHAVFLVQDGEIKTLNRTKMKAGQVLAVGHQLVHQMHNPTNFRFLTFHLYGNHERNHSVTADARVFVLDEHRIQRTDGGVFFALPPAAVQRIEPGPRPDFMTWLRDIVELLKRLHRMKTESPRDERWVRREKDLQEKLFDKSSWDWFEGDLMKNVDEKTGHMEDMGFWSLLRKELTAAAQVQKHLLFTQEDGDPFFTYAELYDDVVGLPCLEEFIAGYLRFVIGRYRLNLREKNFLSIGCGTGAVEEFLIKELGVAKGRLLGIDKSEAMIQVASRRIHAEAKDLLSLSGQSWDFTFCGLNVFQYLAPEQLEQAIAVTARITRPGGYFIGDFITPDHIRTYPHVIRSKNGGVISLRQPVLVERGNCTFQQSEIINVNRLSNRLRITDEGKHLRFLPSLWRLRRLFEKNFQGTVDVYDALTLNPIEKDADTCPSTRILIVAQRGRGGEPPRAI